jgi:hypothetical protein
VPASLLRLAYVCDEMDAGMHECCEGR